MILIGDKEPVRITVGGKEVKEVMLGGKKIWPTFGMLKLYSDSDQPIDVTLYLNDSVNAEFIKIPNRETPYIKQCGRKVTYLKLQNSDNNFLKKFEFENIDEFSPSTFASMFYYLKIEEISFFNIKAPNATSMRHFLKNSTVSKFTFDVEAEKISNFVDSFSNLKNLEEIVLSKIKSVPGSTFTNMFDSNSNLKRCIIPGIGQDVEPYSNIYESMFRGCENLEEVDISSINIASVKAWLDRNSQNKPLFSECPNIKKVWMSYDQVIALLFEEYAQSSLGLPQAFIENFYTPDSGYTLMADGVDIRDT